MIDSHMYREKGTHSSSKYIHVYYIYIHQYISVFSICTFCDVWKTLVWFGKPGTVGYAQPKKHPAPEDDPIMGHIEEDAQEELRRFRLKQQQQQVEFQDREAINRGQVLLPKVEFQESPAKKRKQAQLAPEEAKKTPGPSQTTPKGEQPGFSG